MVLDSILSVLGNLITDPIKQYIVKPAARHIAYAFNCNTKVQTLQDEVQQLKNRKDRLQHSVHDATRNGEEIYENVTEWLSNAEKAIGDAEELVQGKEEAKKRCLVGLCPNFKTRYQLSKKADKKASGIEKLRNEQGLDQVSFPLPPQPILVPSVYSREALPSRVSMLNQIMDALRDPNLNIIGVYGMGGIGKTTLAKEVQGKAVAEKMFETVVLVAVSQTPEFRRIQVEIADFLGLKFDVEGLPGRAGVLHKRLENSKVLIILDDLWQKLDLNAVGIPYGDASKGCKIMLTSRNRDLLSSEMRAQKLFPLEALKDEETLKLFEMSVVEAKDAKFHAIATKIAKKCAGLPLLIQLVATDLQNKDSYEWNDKLSQLSTFSDEEIYGRVYKVLEFSYESLPGEEMKSFFLLCALFGQSNIRIQYLLIHSIGLGLFKHIRTIEGGRDKVLTLINKLKAKSLLLDGDMIGFVKMHDVVRDTALSIASRVQHAFIGTGEVRLRDWPNQDCTRISLPYSDARELPVDLNCPEAELFLLFTEDLSLKMPDSFYERIQNLKVIHFSGMRLMPLPVSIGSLTKLQTLCLHGCRLDNVATIGKLNQLELLSFADSKIIELPKEIEALTQLKQLDLRNCSNLQVIPENVLSKLSSLEELYMLNSFVRWNANGNASLVELESLPNLSTLEIQIENSKSIPQGCRFFDRLRTYKISIGDEWGNWKGNDERSRTLKLKLDAGIPLEDGIEKLLRVTEYLSLSEAMGIESVLYDLDPEGFPQLKHLRIEDDSSIQHLIKSTMQPYCHAFPILESLYLKKLMCLEKICCGQLVMGSFAELLIIKINGCHKLKSLFSFSSAKCLLQLREIKVKSCENLEAIVCEGSEDEHCSNKVIEFNQLSSLKLEKLPKLTGFCRRKEGTAPMELLFNELVSFPNLTSLEVDECKCLKYVFTAPMLKCLGQLKTFDLGYNESVEEIIQIKKDEEIESINMILFPKLEFLILGVLPNLQKFSGGYSIDFPLLKKLRIHGCTAMKNFVSRLSSNESEEEYFFNEMVTFSNLETMQVSGMDFKYLWSSDPCGAFTFENLLSVHVLLCRNLKYVFPASIACGLLKLQDLKIDDCKNVEVIIAKENDEGSEGSPCFVFPQLSFLRLGDLKEMRSLYEEPHTSEWPNLKCLQVYGCHQIMKFWSKQEEGSDHVAFQQTLFSVDKELEMREII
ncbi:probable disease resistance protein At4g27220 isoform X2 [Euphorbia lathyris]|uniref:probable disease resistance protein At4g27220 isoform X2 n=1 Tax=Euphorbia lathyris TaxID=212925 RepID=UPI0033137B77